MTVPFRNPEPDMKEFAEVIRGKKPSRAHFAELFLDSVIAKNILERFLEGKWVEPVPGDNESVKAFARNLIRVWHHMGYDYFWPGVFPTVTFPGAYREGVDTSPLSKGTRTWTDESKGMISSWKEFEEYPWPNPHQVPLWIYEFVAESLPEGMGILMCFGQGVLETVMNIIVGYTPLCYMLHEQPDLAAAIFDKVGSTLLTLHERIIGLPGLIGFFQGEDMGFKTGTLISPEHLRRYVFPWHRRFAGLSHDHGLLYMLHSCGNLAEIIEELITDVGIDAKHSFEDKIMPVTQFKKLYGDRIGVVGGVDVDLLCSADHDTLQRYVENIVDHCMPDGGYALGTGNSVANYIPLENYMTMMEVGARWRP